MADGPGAVADALRLDSDARLAAGLIDGEAPGWFDWAPFYAEVISSAPEGATLVEVGVLFGASTAELARTARAAGRGLRVEAFDTFHGVPPESVTEPALRAAMAARLQAFGGDWEAAARAWLAPYADVLTVTRLDSLVAAQRFAPGACHLVYLDDCHETWHVRQELEAWWPVVAPGGWFAGHDMDWPSVQAAVVNWAGPRGLAWKWRPPRTWTIRKGA